MYIEKDMMLLLALLFNNCSEREKHTRETRVSRFLSIDKKLTFVFGDSIIEVDIHNKAGWRKKSKLHNDKLKLDVFHWLS